MTGPLYLSGDPTASGQASNRHYVANQIAAVTGMLAAKESVGNKDVAGGYAGLDASGHVALPELGAGSATAATCLRGDGSWGSCGAGGGGLADPGSNGIVKRTGVNTTAIATASDLPSHTHVKAQVTDFPTLAAVATSGSYADLSNKPAMAAVATSGSYADLTNKPTIPAAQVQTDWNAASGMGQLLNKPTTFAPSAHTHIESEVTSLLSDLAAKMPSSYLDTDATLAANSDTKVASQKAAKAYADTKLASSALNSTLVVSKFGSGSCSGYLKSDGTCSTPTTSLPAGPTSPNSVAQVLTSTPSGGVAGSATFALAGVAGRAVTGTSDTILVTDRAGWVTYSNASPIAVTLPQAGSTGFASNFPVGVKNIGVGAVTITPTTSTIDGNATLVVSQGQNCTITSIDNANYISRCASGQVTAGANITITPSASGTQIAAAAIPSSYLDTDTALAANSDVKVASQKAVKAYADTKLASSALDSTLIVSKFGVLARAT